MNLNLPYLYFYLVFALGLLFLLLVFMPKHDIRRLFWLGLLWGSGSSFIVEHIYHFVGLTKYKHVEPFNIGFLPLWTIAAWTPAIMLFIYFLPKRKEKYIYCLYLVMWSAFTSFVAVTFRNLGILVFLRGGPWIWFVGGFASYYLLSKFHRFLEAKSEGS